MNILNEKIRIIERKASLLSLTKDWERTFNELNPNYIIGWQNSMTRVWPVDLPVTFNIAKSFKLESVRGENVAFQIIIACTKNRLKDVYVDINGLTGSNIFPTENIVVHPISYVKINQISPKIWYPIDQAYHGWWPDILIDNFPFDVKVGEIQAVWIAIDGAKEYCTWKLYF